LRDEQATETDHPVDFLDPTIRWYLITLVTTAAFLPWVVMLLRSFSDRGASLAKPLALLGLIYPLWLIASISPLPFSAFGLWITLILATAIGWPLAVRSSAIDRSTVGYVALSEGVFLLAFAGFIWFHGYGPDVTYQEKPSDLMMLSSSMRATEMPPHDAWLAGEPINYYYIGYVVLGALGRLVDTTPAVAFNLSLATVFGLTVVGAAGLTGNVIARWRPGRPALFGGLLAAMLVVFLGNPWSTREYVAAPEDALDAERSSGLLFFDSIGWGATRFYEDTPAIDDDPEPITEFPAFSFVLADLHPHLMALPYALLALGIAWLLATLPGTGWREPATLARAIIAGGILGALYAMNSWDLPSYLAVAALALLFGPNGRALGDRVRLLGIVAGAAILLWSPFILRFESPTAANTSAAAESLDGIPVVGGVLASIAGYTGERTSPGEYLGFFGFFYVVAVILIVATAWSRRGGETDPIMLRGALAAGALVVLGALLLPAPLVLLCGLPIVLIVLLIDRDPRFSLANVALGLLAVAFGLSLIPEFFYILDVFSNRMNTIFKVYYQVWVLMALATALAIAALWTALNRSFLTRVALPALVALILAAGLIYPAVAAYQWLEWRSPEREWQGVDGLAYLAESNPDERAAITWLWENAGSDDVLLAAGGCEWDLNVGRTAAATGIPTIIGWGGGHEGAWHLGRPDFRAEMDQRLEDISALYASRPQALIDQYGVTLIYVGRSELGQDGTSEPDPGCATGPFEGIDNPGFPGPGWELVFDQGDAKVFRRSG
jgi:YYY domain-containing protein